MLYVTRKCTFSASHRLYNPDFDHARNEEVFDKCNNVHGHNYTLEVTVAGLPDAATGYVIDLKILKKIIDREIISKVDHQHLNDVEMLRGYIPTAENLAVVFWQVLDKHIESGSLHALKLFESENNFVEYNGDPVILHRYNHALDAEVV